MKARKSIISFLTQHRIRNMNAIYFMETYPIQSLERIGNSLLLRGESDRPWVYISSTDPEELDLVKARLTDDDRCFAAIEEWMVPILTRDKAVIWDLSMVRLLLLKSSVAASGKDEVQVLPLLEEDAQFIYENSLYKEFTSPRYIREQIRKGPSGGIYQEGKLVAWGMTHDDGSIGITHVLQDYRRRGYAHALTLFLVNRVCEQGRIPYLHIEETNTDAMNVVIGLGFQRDRRLHWLEIG
jgi:ribosomal protein S18 acetylase RimI-like enzyme